MKFEDMFDVLADDLTPDQTRRVGRILNLIAIATSGENEDEIREALYAATILIIKEVKK